MSKVKKQIIRTPYYASRAITLSVDPATGRPASLDEANRSVEFIGATEEPTMVMDWERWELVREVLAMSGCRYPASGQVPLLDTHDASSIEKMLGSYRGCQVVKGATGSELMGRAFFDSTPKGEAAFTKVKEGHLTDCSIGYAVTAHIWIEMGQRYEFEGKIYDGPLRIATEWSLGELSLCPIGADPNAKIRASQKLKNGAKSKPVQAAGFKIKENAMPKTQSGGRKTAKSKTSSGLLATLKRMLRSKREEEELEEERELSPDETIEVSLLDEDGEAVDVNELTADQLEVVIEDLEEELATAADEETKGDDEKPGTEQGASGGRAKKVRLRTGSRSFSPSQAVQVERARISALQNLAQRHNLSPEMESEFINNGVSLTAAKAKVYDMTTNSQQERGFTVSMGNTESQKVNGAMQDTLLIRCGLPLYQGDTTKNDFWLTPHAKRSLREPSPGAEEFMALPLAMLCREALLRSGQRVPGDIREIVGRALTATDLPKLLVDTQSRVLMDAFEKAEETWPLWCQTGTATDFKKSEAVGLEADLKPKRKHEHGEYEEGRLAEASEEWFIEEFGRTLHISRRSLINNDLNSLTEIPRECGEQTAELVGDVAYAALLSHPNKMGDGVPLFDTAHRNLYLNNGGIPSVATLGKVVTGMKKQKDRFGKTISIKPRYFLAPVSMETACEQFFNTEQQGRPVIGTGEAPLIHNPYGGSFFARVYDHRLDDVSENNWYLAGPNGTVKVFFLGGVQAPYIESQDDFDRDGVKAKVLMDVGAKAMRWVTLAKSVKN